MAFRKPRFTTRENALMPRPIFPALVALLLLFRNRYLSPVSASASAVTMSLPEFEDLFSSARLGDAERRAAAERSRAEDEHRRTSESLDRRSSDMDARSRAIGERVRTFPENFLILRQVASGSYNASDPASSGVEGDVATIGVELTIRVLDPRWTIVPLVNTSSTVSSGWSVSRMDDDGEEGGGGKFLAVDPVTNPGVMMLVRDGQRVLATNSSGLFRVSFDAHVRVGRTRNLSSLGVGSLVYPLSELSLRVAADGRGGGGGGSAREWSAHPASSVLRVRLSEGYTDVDVTLPLETDAVLLKWMDVKERQGGAGDGPPAAGPDKKEAEAKAEVKEEYGAQVTVKHDVLHTVGEGFIRSGHVLEFTAAGDVSSLSSLSFAVQGRGVRVTSVEGHALQSWNSEEGPGINPSFRLVRVLYKSSQLDAVVVVHVQTELDLEESPSASSGGTELPRIDCGGMRVLRQTGHVAVVNDANVEIHEKGTTGLSRCDASDLPSAMRLNADRPFVLSYRYLNPRHSVLLDVTAHAAVETLQAAVDRAHYRAQVTDSHVVHSLTLIMQITKLQYLELRGLPEGAEMFSLSVNSVPGKPVMAAETGTGSRSGATSAGGSILLPLLIGVDTETANAGGNMRTSVELSYVSRHGGMGANGTLGLSPPQMAGLPVSVLTVHLGLPDRYEYLFSGAFGERAAQNLEYPIPRALSYLTGKKVVKADHRFSRVDDFEEVEEPSEGDGTVKIVIPRADRAYYFSRLFVVGDDLSLNVTYAEPKVFEEPATWWPHLF